MILRSLRLQRFGRFADQTWQLGPGLNVLRGPNEAGKSTIREAIVRLLLPDRKIDTSDRGWLALRTWGASQSFALSCEFECSEGRFALLRDYETGVVELSADGSDERLTDEAMISERLSGMLGIGSCGIYESTACVAQQEFAELQAGRQVSDLLQQQVAGHDADVGVQDVLERLAADVSRLRKGLGGTAKSPGPIRAAMDQIAQHEAEIARLRPIVFAASEAQETIARAEERLSDVQEALEQRRRLKERADERRAIEARLAEVSGRYAELDQRSREARELSREQQRLEGRLAERPDVTEQQVEELRGLHAEADRAAQHAPRAREHAVAAAEEAERAQKRLSEAESRVPEEALLSRAQSLGRDVEEAERDLTAADDAVSRAEGDLGSSQAAAGVQKGWLAAAVVLLLAGAALALTLGEVWPWIVAAAGVVVGVFGALRGPRMSADEARVRHEEALAAAEDLSGQLSMLRAELAQLLERAGAPDAEALACAHTNALAIVRDARDEWNKAKAVAETATEQAQRAQQTAEIAKARLKHHLQQLGAESVESFLLAAREISDLRKQLQTCQSELKGALGGESLEEIDARLTEAGAERMGLQQRLESEEMKWAEMDAERWQQLVAEIERLAAEREELERRVASARGAADHPEADPGRLLRIEEQREAEEEALARLTERLEATELAHELLDQAHRETLSTAIEVLEPQTSELLAALTGGRYGQVSFNRANLAPSVYSEEKGDYVQPEEGLSCATREQVYLAARLALTRLLWPEECPPIMLDDPFVNFDEDRRAQAVRIVRRLAADAQVLLFTCHEHYDDAADHLIVLEAPDSGP